MQKELLNLTKENMGITVVNFKTILAEKSNSYFIKLFDLIISTVNLRPKTAIILCDFACLFYGTLEMSHETKNILLKRIIHVFPSNESYLTESYRLFFLNLLVKNSFFELKSVVSEISILYNNYSGINHYLTLIFIWFAPEIEMADHSFYQIIYNLFVSIWEYDYNSLVIYSIYQNFDKYKENNWEVLKHHRNLDFHNNFITQIISNDSIDEFLQIISSSNYDINIRIPPSSYEWRTYLQKWPTLIQIAAFFGSINCFKFLFLNDAKLDLNDYEDKTVAHFAVAGGNSEIVRILHQKKISFSGTLQVSALFHRNDIFEWLFDNNIVEIDELHEVTGYVLQQAVISNNFFVLNSCLRNPEEIENNKTEENAILFNSDFVNDSHYLLDVNFHNTDGILFLFL